MSGGLPLPAGTIEVDVSDGAVGVPTGATITGHVGVTVIDTYPKTPGANWTLFQCEATSGTLTVSDLTIHGPTAAGETDTNLRNSTVILWLGNGTLVVDNVTVTGIPGRAIQFSGVGPCTITNSSLSGYVAPVARWDGAGSAEPGLFTLDGCTLTGVGSADTSVGVYIHPHIPVVARDSVFEDFARYGVYQNGSPPSVADALIEDCTFRRCSVVQSGSAATVTIRRTTWTDYVPNPGSIIRGHAVIEDCVFESWPWESLAGDGKSITFRRCSWLPGSLYCNFSTGTNLTVLFDDCTWAMGPDLGGTVLIMNDTATGTVTFTGCTITDTALVGDGIRIQGVVTLDRTGLTLTTSRTFWNLGAGV